MESLLVQERRMEFTFGNSMETRLPISVTRVKKSRYQPEEMNNMYNNKIKRNSLQK